MTNDAMREKLVAVANLLADLTGAVAEIAAEFGEVKVEKKEETAVSAEEKKEAAAPERNTPWRTCVRHWLKNLEPGLRQRSERCLRNTAGVSFPP